MNNDINKEMKALLYNFWVVKEEEPDMYYQIKYNQNKIKDFVAKNLGSNLIIHDRFIKLEKIPTILKYNSGIDGFIGVLDYVILTLFLMYLEDKTKSDKFVLSELIEYIKNTSITLELDHVPDWNNTQDRKSLINVIKFLIDINVIKVKDETKVSFIESKDAQALYEVTGISNYVMRLFDTHINDIVKPEEFIKNEFLTQDEARGDVRRYRNFRNILYTPMLSSKDMTISDLDYIKKNRNYIKNEISKSLDMEVEITHNMAILYDDPNSIEKDNFPNNKKITEIVLMVNTKILEDLKSGKLILDEYETIRVKENYLETIIYDIRDKKKPYIGKTNLDLTKEKFYDIVSGYMEKYNMITRENDDITIYPVIGRMIGKTLEVNDEEKQISLFGGSDEL